MENAAKTLTIAGGVLIAIIVVVTLWYSFQQWGIFPQAKEDSTKISQEVAFNKEFESYNKQNLYGTDVITVINKAIANNERYGIEAETEDPYYMDVKITLANNVYTYTKEYTWFYDEETKERKKTEETKTDYSKPPLLYGGKTYSVKNNYVELYNLCKNEPRDVKETKRGNVFTRIEKYSAEEEFRLRYFTCEGIEYDEINGRVKCIRFREVTSDLYDVE